MAGSLQAKIYKLCCVSYEAKSLAWRKLLGDRMCNLCSDEVEEPFIVGEAHFQDVCQVLMTLGPVPQQMA